MTTSLECAICVEFNPSTERAIEPEVIQLKTCVKCGTELPFGSRFCPECGTSTEPITAEATQLSVSKSPIAVPSPPPATAPQQWTFGQQTQTPAAGPPSRAYQSQFVVEDVDVYRRMSAAQKSFVTPAIITLVLYFVFWIPGLVANIVWLLEANNAKRLSGRDPEGRGCLIALIAIPGILFGLAICVWFVILGGALSSA